MADKSARKRIARLRPVEPACKQVSPHDWPANHFASAARYRLALVRIPAQQGFGGERRIAEHGIEYLPPARKMLKCLYIGYGGETISLTIFVHKIRHKHLFCLRAAQNRQYARDEEIWHDGGVKAPGTDDNEVSISYGRKSLWVRLRSRSKPEALQADAR